MGAPLLRTVIRKWSLTHVRYALNQSSVLWIAALDVTTLGITNHRFGKELDQDDFQTKVLGHHKSERNSAHDGVRHLFEDQFGCYSDIERCSIL
jgi:hypothetical protein